MGLEPQEAIVDDMDDFQMRPGSAGHPDGFVQRTGRAMAIVDRDHDLAVHVGLLWDLRSSPE
jgi:hypothetical protein